jgi:hypothetical protein
MENAGVVLAHRAHHYPHSHAHARQAPYGGRLASVTNKQRKASSRRRLRATGLPNKTVATDDNSAFAPLKTLSTPPPPPPALAYKARVAQLRAKPAGAKRRRSHDATSEDGGAAVAGPSTAVAPAPAAAPAPPPKINLPEKLARPNIGEIPSERLERFGEEYIGMPAQYLRDALALPDLGPR